MKKGGGWGGTILVIVLIIFYANGTFDRFLVNFGLNAKPCIQTIFGAVYCADDAVRFCQQEGMQELVSDCKLILREQNR